MELRMHLIMERNGYCSIHYSNDNNDNEWIGGAF